ncbi:MAG: PRC-barrel domain-containing protein [Eubacteriales bacterium]|jgi:YlmC/YmxH family sporulation protein
MFCSFSSLRDKEVINIKDGKILGCVIDIEFEVCTGKICRLVLPPPGKLNLFTSSKNKLYIPWDHIEKIGDDTILVRCPEIVYQAKQR